MIQITHFVMFVMSVTRPVFSRDCDRTHLDNWEFALRDRVKICSTQHPVAMGNNRTNLINVQVRLMIRSYKFYDLEEVFKITVSLFLKWQDESMYWDIKEFGDLEEIVVPSKDLLWKPSLSNLDASDADSRELFPAVCTVNSAGYIHCFPHMKYTVTCSSKLKNWPFDTKECTFRFGELEYEKFVNLTFALSDFSNLATSTVNVSGWQVREIKSEKLDAGAIYVKFILERIADDLEVIILSPVFVIIVLTIVTQFLDPRNKVRFALLCFNVMTCYETMKYLSDCLPKHGVDAPAIVLLVRSSMITTVFVLLSTMFVSSLYANVSPVYLWINVLNDKLLNGYGKYFVMKFEALRDADEVKIKCRGDWADFANIVNSVSAITVITVYIYCILSYLPTKNDLQTQ